MPDTSPNPFSRKALQVSPAYWLSTNTGSPATSAPQTIGAYDTAIIEISSPDGDTWAGSAKVYVKSGATTQQVWVRDKATGSPVYDITSLGVYVVSVVGSDTISVNHTRTAGTFQLNGWLARGIEATPPPKIWEAQIFSSVAVPGDGTLITITSSLNMSRMVSFIASVTAGQAVSLSYKPIPLGAPAVTSAEVIIDPTTAGWSDPQQPKARRGQFKLLNVTGIDTTATVMIQGLA